MLRAVSSAAVLFVFLVANVVPASAAGGLSGNVTGQVEDAAGKPIASPSAVLKQTTNGHGIFNFLTVPVDTYTVSVEKTGFESFGQPGVTVTGDSTTELGVVKLNVTTPKTIARVNARSSSSAFQPNQTVSQYNVGGGVLQAALGKQSNPDETAALLAVPGFQIDKLGDLILQGSTTDEVHFNFDGVDFTDPAENGNGNNYFLNGISNIQVLPGAGDPSQGDAGAGVVNLVVKRGTTPGAGLIDAEAVTRPFEHQLNLQYGISTSNNKVSDFFSFFGINQAFQYGPFGSNSLDEGYQGVAAYALSSQSERDFVNNFVVHFGKNNAQSFQVLYYNNELTDYGNYGGVPIDFDDVDPGVESTIQSVISYTFPNGTTWTPTLAQSGALLAKNPGEGANTGAVPPNPYTLSTTNLLKFEYDNQLDSTTSLALRYFNSQIFEQSLETATQTGVPSEYPDYGGTSGGSRGGVVLQLYKQLDSHNLLTLSGNYEDARPNTGSISPEEGLEALGPNALLFLNPANPNLPATAPGGSNPCPVTSAVYTAAIATPGGPSEACYLQSTYYYKTGGAPAVPPLDLNTLQLQQFFGAGFRDQLQVNSSLRLDLGVRYDGINEGFGNTIYYEDEGTQPIPGSPGTYYVPDYAFVNQPHFIEPRAGIALRLTPRDSIAFSYGRSINETGSGEQATPEAFNAFAPFSGIPVAGLTSAGYAATLPWIPSSPFGNPMPTPLGCNPAVPYPLGAGPNTPPSYKGTVAGSNPNLQLGHACPNLAQLLYSAEDAYFPEITATQPALFNNFDLNYSHEFKNGSAFKISPFFRRGYEIQVATAPLVYNASTGVYSTGSLTNNPNGKNYTSGVDFQFTLPDRPSGITGFFSASYINEFTNTPPAGDNPYGQDFSPVILPQSYASGDLYRAGFVSPFTMNLGLSYKTKNGFRINPVLHANVGFPYNAGSLTPYLTPAGPGNVTNTNATDQFGPAGAPYFIDPANPGSIYNPNIAASRGTAETPSGGGLLSRPQIYGDLTLEYSPPHSRSTFGVQILDLFNNAFYSAPAVNGTFYPVTSGVGNPLTGQSITGVYYPGYAPIVARGVLPYAPYNVTPLTPSVGLAPALNVLPTTFQVYYQLEL